LTNLCAEADSNPASPQTECRENVLAASMQHRQGASIYRANGRPEPVVVVAPDRRFLAVTGTGVDDRNGVVVNEHPRCPIGVAPSRPKRVVLERRSVRGVGAPSAE
jgi:hypothetical protein